MHRTSACCLWPRQAPQKASWPASSSKDSKSRSHSSRSFCKHPRYCRSCSEDIEGDKVSEGSEGSEGSLFRHGLCVVELEDAYTVNGHLLTETYCKQMTADPRVNSFCETPTCKKSLLVAFFGNIFNKPFAVEELSPGSLRPQPYSRTLTIGPART
jgi:hypothetical protein